MSNLEAESWTWYAIVVIIIIMRFTSRFLQYKSINSIRVEDGIMVLVLGFYTIMIYFINAVEKTPTNLIKPGDFNEAIQEANKPTRVLGSKLVIVSEQSWCITIWCIKATMLLLFDKMTTGLRYHLTVKLVAAYVAFSFVLIEILFFAAWCKPFSAYWSVPPKNPQCATYHDHLITNMVFNVTSDLMIMAIPIPLFVRAKLPLRKKVALFSIFSLGLFTILCAILSKFYSFLLPYGNNWVYWYVREVSTAIIIANIPSCWALGRKIFGWREFLPRIHISMTKSSRKERSTPTSMSPVSPEGRFVGVGRRRRWFERAGEEDRSGSEGEGEGVLDTQSAGVVDERTVGLGRGPDRVVQRDLVVSAQDEPIEFDVPAGTHVRIEGLSGHGGS